MKLTWWTASLLIELDMFGFAWLTSPDKGETIMFCYVEFLRSQSRLVVYFTLLLPFYKKCLRYIYIKTKPFYHLIAWLYWTMYHNFWLTPPHPTQCSIFRDISEYSHEKSIFFKFKILNPCKCIFYKNTYTSYFKIVKFLLAISLHNKK